MRDIIKKHSYYELGRMKPQSVAYKLNAGKSKLIKFMNEFELSSLEDFDTKRFLQYVSWLRDTYITQHKQVTKSRLYSTSLWLQQLLDNAIKYHWEGGPKSNIILESSLITIWEQSGQNKNRKLNAQKRLIPDSVFQQIVDCARKESQYKVLNCYGHKYKLVYKSGQAKGVQAVNFTKYCILIQAFTGLRISEVMSLQFGCVFEDKNKRKWLRRKTSKTVLEAEERDVRIPTEIFNEIKKLEKLTLDYRKISGLNNLFFSVVASKSNKIDKLSSVSWSEKYLDKFVKRNNIRNSEGELYKLRSHDFRHTFASKLVNDWNVPLSVLTRHYAHLSMEMTMHYIHISREKLLKKAVVGFTEASKIMANGEVGEDFKKVINEVRVEDNINDLVERLSDSFGLTSLPFGVCLYDYRRGYCPNLGVQSCWEAGCSSFVTSDKFLPNFEHEIDILEKQISRDKHLGKVIEVKKKKIKYDKINKIIKGLSI